MNFKLPIYDIENREVYLKGNLKVKCRDKIFVFRDIRAIYLLGGYYL